MSFDPSVGGEIQKSRPAVVVSNDTANASLNRVQVVPLSSQVRRLYPAEVFVSLGGEPRKAMADQVTTASKQPLRRRLGATNSEHSIGVIKRVFGFWKVRYSGLANNAHCCFVTCALASLSIVRNHLLHA